MGSVAPNIDGNIAGQGRDGEGDAEIAPFVGGKGAPVEADDPDGADIVTKQNEVRIEDVANLINFLEKV